MFTNVLYALAATTVTWLLTLFGAATVLLYKNKKSSNISAIISFSAGIMMAASVWSLIIPSLEAGGCVITVLGIIAGVVFLYLTEIKITKFRNFSKLSDKYNKNLLMMIIAITIHNIPEGLAVGLAFGSLSKGDSSGLLSAIALTIGIALQNFPEGAAISLPLISSGMSRKKSFFIGQASALVEPLFGVAGAIAVNLSQAIIPFCLAFAGGCMIFVVIEDLIPQAMSEGAKENKAFVFIAGFILMMVLDVLL